jgi:hypothetical protein
MTINKILIFLLAFVLFAACEDNPVNQKAAVIIDRDNLMEPGYTWFYPNYNSYSLDKGLINQIEQAFDPDSQKIYIFVKPSCACTGTQFYFPSIIKALDSAKITEANYEMWTMNNSDYSYPYSNLFAITNLPAFVVVKNNVAVYSIMDSVNNILKFHPDSSVKIEYFLLQGLLK